jgi:AcrR family transcriptional regulator
MSITPPPLPSGTVPSVGAVPSIGTAEAIRNAAVALFARHGYEATTVNDIGRCVGIRGSAIYNHVSSKQELLRSIMLSAMRELMGVVETAIEVADDTPGRLRLGIRQHVRYHAQRRLEFSVGNRELPSLEEPARTELVELRRRYVKMFQDIIDTGAREGIFGVESSLIATYSILQSGMGVAVWFDPEGELTENAVGDLYGEFALRTVGYRG